MSGKLVLIIAALPTRGIQTSVDKIWNKSDFIIARKCKPNIMNSFHHHGSIGYYYSFGNKANYAIVDGSSVGVYSNIKNKNEIKQDVIDKNADATEKCGVNKINMTNDLLSKVLPNIKYMISTSVDTADELQNTIGNANLKRIDTASRGCWNVFLSINAMTEHLHTENDRGYTTIKVPKQEFKWTSNQMHMPIFIFKINEKQQLALPLLTHTAFMYSGKFVTHRQEYRCNSKSDSEPFINLASYSNEKLFNHLRKTFDRLTN